ncbi:hypothetical protein BT96DRAFT_161548 [Gymnopus androsaceus JB14]|uniref:U1-type domain-containing protein n=1 Tax=Gymnopus androsaceus JB14 TaxID=1447944 RepID=A0A6A4HA31_9AGAR|nr:hypothetical protein BT96DRAFT_161548 [Gymnopus androsaceus JB14]
MPKVSPVTAPASRSNPTTHRQEWYCTVCTLKMSINNKPSHIAGNRHQKASQASTTVPGPTIPSKSDVHVQGTSVSPVTASTSTHRQPDHEWYCTVCTLRMNISSKPSHIAGKRHQKASQASTAVPGPIIPSESDVVQSTSVFPVTAPALTSTHCQPQPDRSKLSHITGKRHRKASQASTAVPGPTTPSESKSVRIPAGWWECDRCDRAPMKALNRDAHIKSKAHIATGKAPASKTTSTQQSRWYICVPCDKAVLKQERSSHEAGHGVGVGAGISRKIPTSTKLRRKDYYSGPFPSGREYDSSDPESDPDDPDEEDNDDSHSMTNSDVAGLLHDIDTAFGCLPGGGAYKESRQYYGPGKYDYY